MKAAHTPGPWIQTKSTTGRQYIESTEGHTVTSFDDFIKTSDADVTLIAAAPSLLETLLDIADDCRRRLRKGHDNGDTNTLRKCEDAIKLTTGEQS